MRTRNIIYLCLLITICGKLFAQEKPSAEYMKYYSEAMKRTEWLRHARFGMFIHFGAYAVPARGEWVKSVEKMTTEKYQQYIEQFKPLNYNPKEWAKLAKKAGMKYVVMTAKHHDGYCLFDSKYTDYDIASYFKGRDLVKEYLDAFRDEGLKVGLYYSIIDWHHNDYPNVGNHPLRDNEEYGKQEFKWDNYLEYMHNQVEELVTGYGRIDIMWFDYSFGDYYGEKWKAAELVKMVRKHQPGIILNNRLGGSGSGNIEGVSFSWGDFETPEQGIPSKALKDPYGNPIPWEACLTLNNNWGYNAFDNNWKSPELVIHTLVECVSKSGNLLLNVGPNAKGEIPDESVKILKKVGKWMDKNSKSIYGCKAADMPKPEWGRYTQNGNMLYAHWMYPKIGHINVPGIADKVKFVTILADGAEAPTSTNWWGNREKNTFFINVDSPTYKCYELPDAIDTVFEIELEK